MSAVAKPLIKTPVLEPAEDFYRLRREGIGFIEQMGHDSWTDYNIHDPGITILEALCYAITDIAYRAGWDIKDLMEYVGWKDVHSAMRYIDGKDAFAQRRIESQLPAIAGPD